MSILLVIGIILFVLWLLGLFVFSLGALIHIALVIAVIFIIIWLLKAVFRLFLRFSEQVGRLLGVSRPPFRSKSATVSE